MANNEKTERQNGKEVCVQAARAAVRRAGWDDHADLELRFGPDESVSGGGASGYGRGKVSLVLPPDLFGRFQTVVGQEAAFGLRKTPRLLSEMIAAEVYGQVGSFRVCPYGAYDYSRILGAVADGLRSAGASERQIYDHTVRVAGLFISSVIGGVYGVKGPDPQVFRRGTQIARFYYPAAEGKAASRAMTIWSEIQMRLWADDPDLYRAVRSQYPPQMTTVDFEASRGIAILLDTFQYADWIEPGLVWSGDGLAHTVADILRLRYTAWPIKAFQFGELFFVYVAADESDEPNPSEPPGGRRGPEQTDARPSEAAQERRARAAASGAVDLTRLLDGHSALETGHLPADQFSTRLTGNADFRQRVIAAAIGQGPGPRKLVPSYEILDAIYRQRTTRVELPVDPALGKGTRFPIAHLSRRRIDHNLPSFSEIDWGATQLDHHGRIALYRRCVPVNDEIPVRPQIGGIPDLCFVVDSSGSMKWDWENASGPYDCLLRAVYSVEQLLAANGKGHFVRYCAVNFSNSTRRTRWCSFAELREINRLLFEHQNGGTRLDCAVLRQVERESLDPFLCLMVTDGMVSNAAEVAETAVDLANRGNAFVLVHIGQPNPLTNLVTERGLAVHTIMNARDLEGLCLTYSRRTWAR